MHPVHEKAAQIVFPRLGSNMVPPVRVSDDLPRFKNLLKAYPFGGLVLFNGDFRETPEVLAELQSLVKTPLLVGSDIERGAGQQLEGATLFPHLRAAGRAGIEATRSLARITAKEALAGGIHIAFSPVADVNSNPRNPIIGIRAFGTTPDHVEQHVHAFITSCQESGLYATAKHFPGHGNTATDSHAELPVVSSSQSFLEQNELRPFRAAISAGVSAIMTAHVAFPALDSTKSPATSSASILTGLLREQMKFDGITITDSLIMEGIWTRGNSIAETAAQLINAGVDVLLDPPDPAAMVDGIVAALEAGLIQEVQLDNAINRLNVLRNGIKQRLGENIFKAPPSLPAHELRLHSDTARDIAFKAIATANTPSKNKPGNRILALFVLPYKTHLDPPEQPIGALLREDVPGIVYREIYDSTADHQLSEIEALSQFADTLLIFVVAKPAAWRAFGIPERLQKFVHRLSIEMPSRVISMGDPGILDFFQAHSDVICTYSDTEPSQHAIVQWLKDR